MTNVTDPREAVRAIATFGLPDVGLADPFTVEIGCWDDVLVSLSNERLGALAVAAADGRILEIPEDPLRRLLDQQRADVAHCLRLEQELVRIGDALEDARVPFIVLKGPALAHTVYPDPFWRPFRDLDILVRTRDWRTACGVLAKLGCQRQLPEPRRGFDERFGKAATHRAPSGLEIDLHRTLVLGPFGLWIHPDELCEHTATFVLADRSFRRLDDTTLLIHACVHASLGQRQPYGQQLRDIRQVIESGGIDPQILETISSDWHLRPVMRRAMELEAAALGTSWPLAMRTVLETEPSEKELRLLDAYAGQRRARGGTALSSFSAIRRVRDRVAYATALAFPSPEFLQARTGSSGIRARVARLASPIRWLRGRRPARGVLRGGGA